MTEIEENEGPLTPEEVLTFGPVVESQVWNLAWVEERRAPIAVAAGRPKLGKVFNSEGVGRAVLIRPCMSRGKRVRGLAPIYTPKMLEGAKSVFDGWPMYMDHMPSGVADAAKRAGRSVKEIGGQVLSGAWAAGFTMEEDDVFGYQPGAILAEIWANPVVRGLVGENPAALHTSISAWPTSGKPGPAPWNGKKGMVIEGIRRQPQGSVDFVPRGGAGGRILLAEGEAEGWLEPSWDPQDEAIVVSLAESFYASAAMTEPTNVPDFSKLTPAQLREHIEKNAPHLVSALAEAAPSPAAAASAPPASGLTEADVQAIVAKAIPAPTETLSEAELTKLAEDKARELFEQREGERHLAGVAHALISEAEGIPASWKADLQARYAMLPSGPAPALVVEEGVDDDGTLLSEEDVLRARVEADLKHARDLIAEATGKPRVTGEGGSKKTTGDERVAEGSGTPYWREAFAEYGIVESADKALAVHGVDKVEGS